MFQIYDTISIQIRMKQIERFSAIGRAINQLKVFHVKDSILLGVTNERIAVEGGNWFIYCANGSS